MEHVLDNPAWNALISGNENLHFGDDHIRYFDWDVSPFVGFKENTKENFRELYDKTAQGRVFLFVAPNETEIPAPWKVLDRVKGNQMVYQPGVDLKQTAELTTLTQEHVPQMLSLTKLTNPGPFAERTIDFGHYRGIFENGELTAMAGQRLHAFNFAEISAVCTRPDHTGKGHARQLLIHQVNRIQAAGEIPYLHVRSDNDRAIKVYESLGFVTRCNVWFWPIQKAK